MSDKARILALMRSLQQAEWPKPDKVVPTDTGYRLEWHQISQVGKFAER